MSIGSRIKEKRIEKGLTRKELATMIGVTPYAVANYENGVSVPKIEIMSELIKELECDANYIYQDETVNVYLPYQKGEYNSESPTENALRIRKCRHKTV